MKIIAVTQARLGSTRLPNKVLMKIDNKTLLELHLNRVMASAHIGELIVATTTESNDQKIVDYVSGLGIASFRGSEEDVLDRFYQCVKDKNADYIVRLTSDCPLIDSDLIDKVINFTIENKLDYGSNVLNPSYPDGQDVEVFKFSALKKAWRNATLTSDREHVTPYIWRNSTFLGKDLFQSDNFEEGYDFNRIRMTVDESVDFELVSSLVKHCGTNSSWLEYTAFIEKTPEVLAINAGIVRNEGFQKSLEKDKNMGKGQQLYKKAKNLIPGGTMLLSKRPEMFLPDNWPAYYSKAKGCHIWDLDGNKFLDMSIMGIGTNILGYGHEEVDEAVRAVIQNGNMSTLNCPEEVALAERLIGLHPWADMARFCRTGGEANAVAIRIARAASGKDKVAICGYHGWHDWYISTNLSDKEGLTNHLLPGLNALGVPKGLANTTIPFTYNDINLVKDIVKNNPDLGTIKMEVSRNHGPNPGYLEEIRKIATENNIILIFDECTSGFRETFGGLHKKYNVEPDMAMFGKAMGNGYAVTGVIGKRAIMEAAQKTFISSTFWTERIGSAAALATLDVMEREASWNTITTLGTKITNRWKTLAAKYDFKIQTGGLPSLTWFSLQVDNWLAYKTYITQEMLKKGILASNSIYVSVAHKEEYVNQYFFELEKIFQELQAFENGKDILKYLEGPICHGGFKRLN